MLSPSVYFELIPFRTGPQSRPLRTSAPAAACACRTRLGRTCSSPEAGGGRRAQEGPGGYGRAQEGTVKYQRVQET